LIFKFIIEVNIIFNP